MPKSGIAGTYGRLRDESTWVVTHLYIEGMLGISLYSYPYLN
jgi:hypothetical protein